MISFLTFIVAIVFLLAEGWLLARLLIRDTPLCCALALPLAAVGNVLLTFLYTVATIPLSPLSLGLGHATIIALLATTVHVQKRPVRAQQNPARQAAGKAVQEHGRRVILPARAGRLLLRALCLLLLANIAAFNVAHALLLHTFSIDSLTNWTMRSKISYTDQRIAFDTTEDRGMAKPQYPFLVHALQIAANQGQPAWSDRAANAVTWLLSLSAFTALFLMLKRWRGADTALLALTLILSIPLLSIHLAQGYGDIHLIAYLLLALVTLTAWKERNENAWLLLSAIFILGAMWTKLEGLFFGFVPWAGLVLLPGLLPIARNRLSIHFPLFTIAGTFALFLPFLLLLLVKDLPLTPHGTDTVFAWHPEGLAALWPSVFGHGSFGIIWYVLPVATMLLLIALRRNNPLAHTQLAPLLLWGWLIVLENMVIYLVTPNVRFLLNGESFSRQMLPAGALIILACAMIVRMRPQAGTPAADKLKLQQHPGVYPEQGRGVGAADERTYPVAA